MPLSIFDTFRVQQLINDRGWHFARNNKGQQLREALADFLSDLTEEQREFAFLLLENFLIIQNYESFCGLIADEIKRRFGGKKILLFPVCDNKHDIQSGHSVQYELKRFLWSSDFANIKFVDHPDSISSNDQDYFLIGVDDYIGSGKQVSNMLRALEDRIPGSLGRASIFAICAQAVSKKKISEMGCHYLPLIIRFRAIKDKVAIGNLDVAESYRIYDEIEQRLSMPVFYKRGYRRSEALVCLKRTPNNTLPIFWHMRQKGRKAWPAPLPREL